MTTKPARSRCRTTRSAAVAAMYSTASCFRFRPSNLSENAIASARSRGSAGVRFSLASGIRRRYRRSENEARTVAINKDRGAGSEARGFKRAVEATRPTSAATTFASPAESARGKKRKWNIFRAASFQSHRSGAQQPWEKRESLMVPTSCLVLRGGLAVAVAVLASSLSGTIAVAQQIAVNVEGKKQRKRPPRRGATDDAYARQIVLFHTSEAPLNDHHRYGPTRSLLPRSAERSGHPLWHRGRAHRFPMVRRRAGVLWGTSGRTGAPCRKWSDGRPHLPRFMAGGPGNPRGASPLSRSPRLPHPRNQLQPETIGHAVSSGCVFSLRQCRCDRPLRPRPGRRKSPRQAVGPRFLMRTRGLKGIVTLPWGRARSVGGSWICQVAATAVRYVSIATARSARCVRAEVR